MSTPALPGIFAAMAPALNHYGYFAVAGLLVLEDFGIPVPGETVLIAAALYAGAGRLNVVLLGVIATLAAIIGDNIGFAIGHLGGRALALRFGKYVFLTAERLDKAEYFFSRHGGKIIVAARFIEGLRQANGIVAGISGMHWKRFLVFNALGAALWVGVWVSLGDLAGNYITTIYNEITRYSLYVLVALVVVVVVLVVRWLWRRRARRQAQQAQPGAQPGAQPEAQTEAQPEAQTGAPAASDASASAGSGLAFQPQEAAETGEPGETGAAGGSPGASEPCGASEPEEAGERAVLDGEAGARETGDRRDPGRQHRDGEARDREALHGQARDREARDGERAAPRGAGDRGAPGQSRRGSS